jgi:hypothetical protein
MILKMIWLKHLEECKRNNIMPTLYDRIEQAKQNGYSTVQRFGGYFLVAPNGAWLSGPFDTELYAWANGGIPEYVEPIPEPTPEPEKKPARKRATRKKKVSSDG